MKKLSKIPLCTIINRHLLYPAPSSLKHSTTGSHCSTLNMKLPEINEKVHSYFGGIRHL